MTTRTLPLQFRSRGVSLLEALITIVILAFGILGLANLQAKMQNAEVESYARSQAIVLLDDMAARVSANRANAAAYVALAPTGTPAGTADAQPTDCVGAFPAPGADRDVCEWSNALKGSTELSGTIAVGAMIGGRGCVDQLAGMDPPSYRVTVAWQGLSTTIAPNAGIDCAQGSYGADDAYRRVVTKIVAVANLAPGP
jgi:type IV pilus assembly protein PilV